MLGTFYNLTGATIGATLAFLIARYLASDWVTDKTGGRLKQLINGVEGEDVLVLDVRTPEDFVGEQGHIGVATNIPVEELGTRLAEISDYQERPVVTVCRSKKQGFAHPARRHTIPRFQRF